MNQPIAIKTELSRTVALQQVEATLRQVAELPAPAGLEMRLHAALEAAPRRGKVLAWPAPQGSPTRNWMRGAAAAAIVTAIVGGSWGVYSRVQPGEAPRAVVLPRVTTTAGFSNAGAMRTPQTLTQPPAAAPKPVQPQADASAPKPAASAKKHAAPAH